MTMQTSAEIFELKHILYALALEMYEAGFCRSDIYKELWVECRANQLSCVVASQAIAYAYNVTPRQDRFTAVRKRLQSILKDKKGTK